MNKKKIFIFSGVGALIIILGIIAFIKGKGADVSGDGIDDMEILVEKVKEEELEETILVTGEIVPEDEQKIYADLESGDIKEFQVKENDKVKAGDVLFVYDTSSIETEFNSATRARDLIQNRVKAEENQIAKLNKQIEQAKSNVGKRVVEESKNEDEEDGLDETFITQEHIDELEMEREQLLLELESTKAEVASAQDEINEIDKRKKEMTVVSKIDGTVVKVNKNIEKSEEGTTEPVIHIVSDKPFKVIGSMSEFDAVKIKKKQDVIIRPKVFKDREWKGKVESVSQYPSDDGGGDEFYGGGDGNVTMYPFTVAIKDDTKDLRQGFHVSLEVKVSGKKALVVPHMAIVDDMMFMSDDELSDDMFLEEEVSDKGFMEFGEGPSYVYVLVDGILEQREVEIGDMSDEFVEIIDGLSLDELVVITPHEAMHDGMEVSSYDEVE